MTWLMDLVLAFAAAVAALVTLWMRLVAPRHDAPLRGTE